MNLNNLPANTTIITANHRLATYLRRQYDASQQAAGRMVWETLDCLALDQWLARCSRDLPHAGLLLNHTQALVVWEQIIVASFASEQEHLAFLSPRALATTALTAWHTLQQWQTPLSALANASSQDVQTFYRWATQFVQLCRQANWFDSSVATAQLIAAISKIPLTKHIVLAGFLTDTELAPQTRHLFAVLQQHSDVQIYQPEMATTSVQQRVGLPDVEQELYAMAQWARDTHRQHPDKTIGCVIPNLTTTRDNVERIFTEVFTVKLNNHDVGTKLKDGLWGRAREGVFGVKYQDDSGMVHGCTMELQRLPPIGQPELTALNISGGSSLYRCPLIQAAFDLLALNTTELDAALLSRWLRSPFWGGAEQEFTARAMLDVCLREAREPYFTWRQVLRLAEQRGDCALLLQHCGELNTLLAKLANTPAQQSARAWAQQFAAQLHSMGWPGERTLNSAEYQQHQRWQELLSVDLGQIDAVLSTPLTAARALQLLTQMAQETLFQTQTREDAHVQVLGMLEAVNLSFDYLWISGMTQEDWPQAPAPNPFIPLALQRTCQMPHASAERELTYSRTLTARLNQCAPQVIFSYAMQQGDLTLAPSALIVQMEQVPLNPPPNPPQAGGGNIPPPACGGLGGGYFAVDEGSEEVPDDYAPPWRPTEKLHGGASLFKHQSACPFRALAKVRLGVQPLPSAQPTITPAERGVYLHNILEQLWNHIKDHATLCQYDQAELELRVKTCVDTVLTRYADQRPYALRPRYQALERERLLKLTLAWLAIEKQRPPFRVVATESAQSVEFAGLSLKLRLDRQDELDNGAYLVIDYKTGVCSPTQWFGERPDDPQLPLYGITSLQPVQGLAFAQVIAGKLQFKGISAEDYAIVGVQVAGQSQQQTLQGWGDFYAGQQTTLTRLAEQFKAGYAKVDPKDQHNTCGHCNLQVLCRVHEHTT